MDKSKKRILQSVYNGLSSFFSNTGKTLSSLMRMCLLSSIPVAIKSKKYCNLKGTENCCVLGNGPSLKDDLDNRIVRYEGNDVFCVNMFCSSEFFRIIKPRFYFLIDGSYFSPTTERNKALVRELIKAFQEVDWEMFLMISTLSVSGGELLNSLNNDNIKLIKLNSTEVNGFKGFRRFFYRKRMGMPRCQTVVNFALCAAVNMDYKNIYLYGADHTWTRDLFVDKDNVVCYGDRHVYNKNLAIVKKNNNFAYLLGQFAKMFQAHYLIEDYSKSQGVKIWNCSSDTFLDAYERI